MVQQLINGETKEQFWERKCKEAERELLINYKTQKAQSQEIANLCGALEDLRNSIRKTSEEVKVILCGSCINTRVCAAKPIKTCVNTQVYEKLVSCVQKDGVTE